jgi:hypothetical protein
MAVSSYTLLDVVNRVGFRAGNFKGQKLETLANPDWATEQMIECVNEAFRDMNRIRPLPARNARAIIQTVEAYDTGTVTVTNGSMTVTGSGTTWTSAMVDRAFALKGVSATYRISAFVSATEITLDKAWHGNTAATEGYTIAQDRYNLPSDFFDFITANLEGAVNRPLEIIRPSEVDTQRFLMRGRALVTGSPQRITVYDQAAGYAAWQIETDLFSDLVYRIVLRYQATLARLTQDSQIVPIPDENIDFLVRGAVALWREITGGPELSGLYNMWLQGDLSVYATFDSRKTDQVARIIPEDNMRSLTMPRGRPDWGPNR